MSLRDLTDSNSIQSHTYKTYNDNELLWLFSLSRTNQCNRKRDNQFLRVGWYERQQGFLVLIQTVMDGGYNPKSTWALGANTKMSSTSRSETS